MEAELDFNKCSDETLIDIYRKGDEAAIEVLFERYKDIVRKKAKGIRGTGTHTIRDSILLCRCRR